SVRRLGLDLEPAVSRAESYAEEAQKAFLPEQVEGERPGITKTDRRVVTHTGDGAVGASVSCGGRRPADMECRLGRPLKVDAVRGSQPSAQPVGDRPARH